MRSKHLERGYDLRQRHRPVVEPLLIVLDAVHKDDEVVLAALVVDLNVVDVAASHFDGWIELVFEDRRVRSRSMGSV